MFTGKQWDIDMKYYSPSTRGFYIPEIHGAKTIQVVDPAWKRPTHSVTLLPGDSVVVTESGDKVVNTGTIEIVVPDVPDFSVVAPMITVKNPASTIPDDVVEITDERHSELLAGQASGQQIVPGEDGLPILIFPEPAAPAPVTKVTRFQGKRWLIRNNMWQAVLDAKAALTGAQAFELDTYLGDADYWEIDHPMVAIMQGVLGITDVQLQEGFNEASQIIR